MSEAAKITTYIAIDYCIPLAYLDYITLRTVHIL